MIISHKHKFIFIKTVKTAGTSLEVFLSQHCGPDDVLTPFAPPSRDTSRVTTKDPLDPSLKSCVSHSGRGLPGAASSLDTSAFTIICRPGLFDYAFLPPSGTVISSFASNATRGIRFCRITTCTLTVQAAPSPSINTSPEPSSRSITRVTPIHPDQELWSIELFVMKI
ncbi:MAG: hypothetical protein DMF14_00320 [Verrucomicrobia bacterium]|nr:MAG: hypothetical protein DMF14_00320 [Verrucomicrobiota bacterium]